MAVSFLRIEVRVYALGSKKPVTTLRFDETNIWTGWPEILRFVNGILLQRGGNR